MLKEVWLALIVAATGTFQVVKSQSCPAQGTARVCTCTADTIDCHEKAISTFPSFNRTNSVFKLINLSNNNLSTIPARAFLNVNISEIDLRSNRISVIEDDAFSPLEKSITLLDLRDNRLIFLPDPIAKLTDLVTLDVSYNPIPFNNFSNDVMREIGDNMEEFRFGDESLRGWPESLHHLQMLKILKFYGGSDDMDRIPITAFHGFEWTLQKLWMQKTKLIAVPIALQDLRSVNELHFDDNIYVGDAGILIPAFAHLTETLHTMSLENNSLTTFPSVLLTLKQLHNLSLARNKLEFISDQAVSVVGSNLTTINLQTCHLDRIPGALSKLSGLINLDFSYNNITTIEKNDLQRMNHLRSLNVSFNPLQYVSRSTFYDLRQLDELVLKETFLYLVPEAITNIPNIRVLDLTTSDPYIECNCDLTWLYCYMKNNNTQLRVNGKCETVNELIENYAKTDIPDQCPVHCS